MTLPPFSIAEFEPLVQQIGDKLKPLLAGKHPALASAVLADLTALWVVSHCVTKDRKVDIDALASRATRHMQRKLLQEHMALVRHFISVNAGHIAAHHEELPTYFLDEDANE